MAKVTSICCCFFNRSLTFSWLAYIRTWKYSILFKLLLALIKFCYAYTSCVTQKFKANISETSAENYLVFKKKCVGSSSSYICSIFQFPNKRFNSPFLPVEMYFSCRILKLIRSTSCQTRYIRSISWIVLILKLLRTLNLVYTFSI